jgi:hypothetical protein
LPAVGDRKFLHGFQQGGLRFGRRAVDLVGQHDVGKQRPPVELEKPLARGVVLL